MALLLPSTENGETYILYIYIEALFTVGVRCLIQGSAQGSWGKDYHPKITTPPNPNIIRTSEILATKSCNAPAATLAATVVLPCNMSSFGPMPQQAVASMMCVLKAGRFKLPEEKEAERRAKFLEACQQGDAATAKELFTMERGRMADGDGNQPIHWACGNGQREVAMFLTSKGVALGSRSHDGSQPIHWACLNGELAVAQWINDEVAKKVTPTRSLSLAPEVIKSAARSQRQRKQASVVIEAADQKGSRPIHYSSLNGQLAVVKWLHEVGAELDARDNDGVSALHWACQQGHLATAEWLMQASDAAADAQTNDGSRPIHWASFGGNLDVVRMLHESGVPLDVVTKDGLTPLQLAKQSGQTAVAEWLAAATEPLRSREPPVSSSDEVDGLTA